MTERCAEWVMVAGAAVALVGMAWVTSGMFLDDRAMRATGLAVTCSGLIVIGAGAIVMVLVALRR